MRAALVASLSLVAPLPAQNQCFPVPQPSGSFPGLDRNEDSWFGHWVHATAWDPDGSGPLAEQVAVGGTFRVAGSARTDGVAVYDPLTGTFRALPIASAPESMFAGPAGQLLCSIGGLTNARLLQQWNGVSWTPVGVFDGPVAKVAWLPNGQMLVAGSFASVDGTTATGLAIRNGTTWQSVATIWQNFTYQAPGIPPFPYNGPGWVFDVAVLGSGELVIAGAFDSVDGVPARGIARWDGTQWQSMGAGVTGPWASGVVEWSGAIIAGGSFATGPLVIWDGANWQPFAPMPPTDRGIVVTPSNELLAIGTTGVAQLTPSGWTELPWDNQWLTGVVPMRNGELYAFGEFDSVDGVPAARIARYDGEWHTLGDGFNRPAVGIARLDGGDLLVGGAFTGRGELEVSPLQRYDGVQWRDVVVPRDTSVTAVARGPHGEGLALGSFPLPAARVTQPIVRIVDHTLQVLQPTSFWNDHLPLAMAADGAERTQLACMHRLTGRVVVASWDGATLTSHLVPNLLGEPSTLLVESDGTLTIGGDFTGPAGSWQVVTFDGTNWSGLVNGLDGDVHTLLREPDGNLLIGGAFRSGTIFNLARWNGVQLSGLPGAWDGPVHALAHLPDGDLLVFSKWIRRSNGSSWQPLVSFEDVVRGAVIGDDGSIDAVGDFGVAGAFSGGNVQYVGAAHYLHLEPPCPALADAYGAGCASAAGPVELRATRPWLGTTVVVTTTGVPNGGVAVPVLGLGSTALPLLPWFPQADPACQLLVTPDTVLGMAPATNGLATTSLPLPSSATLVGFEFHLQTFPFAIVGGALHVASSGALHLTLGTL